MSISELNILVQRSLPLVYDDSLTFVELLGQVVAKINELTAATNTFLDQDMQAFVEAQLLEWYNDGTLNTIIDAGLDIKVGTLADLDTTDKTSCVDAINEVVASVSALETDVEDLKSYGVINALYPPAPLVAMSEASADNSVALNAMIAVATEIFIPAGTYVITNPIVISPNEVTIKGEAQGTIIQNNGTGDAISIPNDADVDSRICLDTLRVLGTDLSGIGLNCQVGGFRLIVRDCEFSMHGDAGAWLYQNYSANFINCQFSTNCRKVTATKLAGCYVEESNNVNFIGCHFNQNQQNADGVYMKQGYANTFDGCQFERNTGNGVTLYDSKGITLNSPYVEANVGDYGLLMTGASTSSRCYGIVINGGFFNGGDAGVRTTDYGIGAVFTRGLTVNGSHFIYHVTGSILLTSTALECMIQNISTSITVTADSTLLIDQGVNNDFRTGNKRPLLVGSIPATQTLTVNMKTGSACMVITQDNIKTMHSATLIVGGNPSNVSSAQGLTLFPVGTSGTDITVSQGGASAYDIAYIVNGNASYSAEFSIVPLYGDPPSWSVA